MPCFSLLFSYKRKSDRLKQSLRRRKANRRTGTKHASCNLFSLSFCLRDWRNHVRFAPSAPALRASPELHPRTVQQNRCSARFVCPVQLCAHFTTLHRSCQPSADTYSPYTDFLAFCTEKLSFCSRKFTNSSFFPAHSVVY